MSIRKKILVALGVIFLVLAVLLNVFSRTILLDSYRSIESESAQQDVQRVLNAVQTDIETLESIVGDWSTWDETFDFVNGENPDYADTHLSAATLSNLGIHFMLFFDAQGALYYGEQVDFEAEEYIEISEDLLDAITMVPSLFMQADSGAEDGLSGVLVVNNQPHSVAALPILTNQDTGPIAGTLLMGFPLDKSMFDDIGERTESDLSRRLPFNSENQAIFSSLSDVKPVHIETVDGEWLEGYGLVNDLSGEPAFSVMLALPRNIYQQGINTLNYFLGMILAAGLVFALGMMWQLDRLILSRLARLANEVQLVGNGHNITQQVTESGEDEVTIVARNVNQTLAALNHTQNELMNERSMLEKRVEERTIQLEGALAQANLLGTQLTTTLEQERLINAQRANFVKTVSHVFRTPITSIGISSDMLIRHSERLTPEKRTKHVKHIVAGIHTLTGLLEDAVDANSYTLEQVDFQPEEQAFAPLIIALESALLGEMSKASLVNFAFDRLSQRIIFADGDLLKQLLSILVENAVKFGLGKRIAINILLIDESLEICVSDEGIGIPPAELKDLFQLFARAANAEINEGLGLGLFVAKQIVSAMGGSISAESPGENQGSTFTAKLSISFNPVTSDSNLRNGESELLGLAQ